MWLLQEIRPLSSRDRGRLAQNITCRRFLDTLARNLRHYERKRHRCEAMMTSTSAAVAAVGCMRYGTDAWTKECIGLYTGAGSVKDSSNDNQEDGKNH